MEENKKLPRKERINKIQKKAIEEQNKSRSQLYKETKGTKLGLRYQDFLKLTKKARQKGKPTIKPKTKQKKPKTKEKKESKGITSEKQRYSLMKGQVKNKYYNQNKSFDEIKQEIEGTDLEPKKNFHEKLQKGFTEITGTKPTPTIKEGYDLYRYEDSEGNEFFIKENSSDPFTLDRFQQVRTIHSQGSGAKQPIFDNLEYIDTFDYTQLEISNL